MTASTRCWRLPRAGSMLAGQCERLPWPISARRARTFGETVLPMRAYLRFAIVGGLFIANSAHGMTQLLMEDLGIHGTQHWCKYSDNKVYAFDAMTLCPMQIEDSGTGQSRSDDPPVVGVRGGKCLGSAGPGGPCSTGPGGGLSAGPGGGLSAGPGGGLSAGPGGGLSHGPGGGMSAGPGGGLSYGPGGGLSSGPGGGLSYGPRTGEPDEYKGPWGPCITGAASISWLVQNCPNRR
jgi:hypothetical protein